MLTSDLERNLLPYAVVLNVKEIRIEFSPRSSVFPDSTRRGDAEQGDNNQVLVALVLLPFS